MSKSSLKSEGLLKKAVNIILFFKFECESISLISSGLLIKTMYKIYLIAMCKEPSLLLYFTWSKNDRLRSLSLSLNLIFNLDIWGHKKNQEMHVRLFRAEIR